MDLIFPLGGLDRRFAYQYQRPYTTPDCLNVRPDGTIEGRERGGSRPGLTRAYTQAPSPGGDPGGPLGDTQEAPQWYYESSSGVPLARGEDPPLVGSPIRLLESINVLPGDGFTYWIDEFSGTALPGIWGPLALRSYGAYHLPTVEDGNAVATYPNTAGALRELLDILPGSAHTLQLLIPPARQDPIQHQGGFSIVCRIDDEVPGVVPFAVEVLLVPDALNVPHYAAYIYTWENGMQTQVAQVEDDIVATDIAWFSVFVNRQRIKATWGDVLLFDETVVGPTGRRFGFTMRASLPDSSVYVDTFRAQYFQEEVESVNEETILVASASGHLYRETDFGIMEQVETEVTLASDYLLQGTAYLQKLYIADHGLRVRGTDGLVVNINGSMRLFAGSVDNWHDLGIEPASDVCVISNAQPSELNGVYRIDPEIFAGWLVLLDDPVEGTGVFRIERAPKVYDPARNTLEIWSGVGDDSFVPVGCPLIALYSDRLWLAGGADAPHLWYASRKGDPDDWDYSQISEGESDGAVSGQTTGAGGLGNPMTAMVPTSDDYLLMSTAESLDVLRGDPGLGASLDSLSRVTGIMGQAAWCRGPNGETFYLTRDGVYGLSPGANQFPVSLSREVLPRELQDIDPVNTIALLAFDIRARGVHIYLTQKRSGGNWHFWFDGETQSFWPVNHLPGHEPTAIIRYGASAATEAQVLLGGRDGFIRRFENNSHRDDGFVFDSFVDYGPILLGSDSEADGMLMELTGVPAMGSGQIKWYARLGDSPEEAYKAEPTAFGEWSPGLNYTDRPRLRGNALYLKMQRRDTVPWAIERIAVTRRRQLGKVRKL